MRDDSATCDLRVGPLKCIDELCDAVVDHRFSRPRVVTEPAGMSSVVIPCGNAQLQKREDIWRCDVSLAGHGVLAKSRVQLRRSNFERLVRGAHKVWPEVVAANCE